MADGSVARDFHRDLVDRVALVTGGSRGIGRAVALELAGHGADVAITYVQDANGAEETAAAIQSVGAQCHIFKCDISDRSEISTMLESISNVLSSPDILVNNAGITRDGLMIRMNDEDWDAVIETDLAGAFRVTRGCLRGMMRNRWGRIINIGSVIGTIGNAGQSNYAAAKAGLAGMTKALAQEVGSRGITVNLVAPGFIQTDITAGLSQETITGVLTQIPLNRLGTPTDVAPLMAFLAGDSSQYITGQVIHIDGGMVRS